MQAVTAASRFRRLADSKTCFSLNRLFPPCVCRSATLPPVTPTREWATRWAYPGARSSRWWGRTASQLHRACHARRSAFCASSAARVNLTRPPTPRPAFSCSDKRLGANFQTVSCDFQKIFKMHDRLYVGINGLPTDVQTMCGPPHKLRVPTNRRSSLNELTSPPPSLPVNPRLPLPTVRRRSSLD
jgi:hypothetical protein